MVDIELEAPKNPKNAIYKALARLRRPAQLYNSVLPWFYWGGKAVPNIESELLLIPAHELAKKIRHQEIKSVDIVNAYISRIQQVNPVINAVASERFDDALVDAQKADELCQQLDVTQLENQYPLLGIPFSIKECIGVKGMSFHCGVYSRKDEICQEDGDCVKLLKAAGAIPIVASNIPEWCINYETLNKVVGITRNPFDPNRSAAGSSGGEAALISSCGSLFGVGTDLLGSVRLPACFTNIYGHRPTSDIVPKNGSIPYVDDPKPNKLLAFGPMTRYAKDLTTILKVIGGENVKKLDLDKPVKLNELKVYYLSEYPTGLGTVPIIPELDEKIKATVALLEKTGAKSEPLNISFSDIFQKVMHKMAIDLPRDELIDYSDIPKKPDPVKGCQKEFQKWLFGQSNHDILAIAAQYLVRKKDEDYMDEQKLYARLADKMERELEEKLKENCIIILPGYPEEPYFHYGSAFKIHGLVFFNVPSIFNFPATCVPAGLTKKNQLPIGMQIVAGRYQDRLGLAVAEYLEENLARWTAPWANIELANQNTKENP